jgi:predicted TIM-barrel fold metal-dependent hydrolase
MKVNEWVDVHAHFTPPISGEERVERWQGMRAAAFLAPEPYQWSPETTIAAMDRSGVRMQLLSNIPRTVPALQASNDYAAALVRQYPDRFGMLAALPTDGPDAALAEIERTEPDGPDGYALTCCYNGVYLGDDRLRPVWAELDRRGAVVHAHPNAYADATLGRPAPLYEVAFETGRTMVDLLYNGVLRDFPNATVILAHCGGAGPALAGRLELLGNEAWVPNPRGITRAEIREQLGRLYVDTAATATTHLLAPAVATMGAGHLVYGSDSGVPCSTDATIEANVANLYGSGVLSDTEVEAVGRRALDLFPAARHRLAAAGVPA